MVKKAVTRRRLGANRGVGVPPVPLIKPYDEMGSGGTAVFGGRIAIRDESPQWIGKQRWRTAADLAVNSSVIAAGVHYLVNLISHPKWTAVPNEVMQEEEREKQEAEEQAERDANNPFLNGSAAGGAVDEEEGGEAKPKFPPQAKKRFNKAAGGEAKEMADYVNDVLANMKTPWPNVVRHAGIYRFNGFSLLETTYQRSKERDDGNIGIEAIELRPCHTIELWAVDEQGTIEGVFQRSPQTSELLPLPRKKLLYLVEDTLTDSPDGIGVFRHLLEPWNRLKQFLALETRAYERDLRGIPVGRAPLTLINNAVQSGRITRAEADTLIAGIRDMIQTQVKQSDTGLLLDSQPYQSTSQGGPIVTDVYQWTFELLNGPGLGLSEIHTAIERLQREMARIMGVEHLMLGDAGGNSGAVAKDKSRNVYLIASAVLNNIVACVQRDVIEQLWVLNGFDRKVMPKLIAEDIAPRDVVEVTTSLARMAQAGAVLDPKDPVIDDVRTMLGVSKSVVPEDDPAMGGIDPLTGLPIGGPEIDPATGQPIEPDPNAPPGEEGEEDEEGAPFGGKPPKRKPGRPGGRKPKGNAEMQRLPRGGALSAKANGRGH